MFNELKTLVKHSSVYGISEFLRKGIGFIMIPIYTRYLTPADYGLLELLDLTLNVIAILVGLGIGSALIRYYHNFDNIKDKQEVFTTALTFAFILSFMLIGVLELFSTPISDLILGGRQYSKYFQIIFICLVIQNVYLVPENYLIAQKKSLVYSILSLGTLVSNLSLNILFLVFLKMGVLGILISMLITKALNMLVVSMITLRNLRYSFSWKKLKEMMSFGMPLMPAAMGMFVIHFSDRFFIQQFCNLHDVGIYSLGYKLGMILSIIVSAPIFRIWDAQRFEIAKTNEAQKVFKRIFTYYFSIVVFSGLGISVFIDEIISIMAASEYQGAANVVPIIVLSYIFFGTGHFFNLGIMVTNRTKYVAYIQCSVAGVNILFNLLLISRYGVMGAAVATALSFLLLCALTFVVSQRLYPIAFEYGRAFIVFSLALLIFGLSRLIDASLLISLGIKSLLIIAFPLVLIIGKFFYKEEMNKGIALLKGIGARLGLAKG
jgi:O-antigen/teichoic acid export membrane protein